MQITINGKQHDYDGDPAMPLLWFIRDDLKMKGTKYGCGMALCGACTVHVEGNAVRACQFPMSGAAGKSVTTIEGLDKDHAHPLQIAWAEENVPQCGYCQSGQIMQAASLLSANPSPSDEDIERGMSGNICRCGTYPRIRCAIKKVTEAGK